MAVPKKRTSKSRKNKRKTAWKQKVKQYSLTVSFTTQFHQSVYLPWKEEKDKKTSFKGFQRISDNNIIKVENAEENS